MPDAGLAVRHGRIRAYLQNNSKRKVPVSIEIVIWISFNLFVLAMLALDLGVFHRKSHAIKIREALIWSAVWIGLALIFNACIYFWQGSDKALMFLTGYLIEKSLSVDNLFVFLMIFSYFNVPTLYQHKVLFWGIIGALIQKFHWIIYIFGIFLIFTGIKMALKKDKEVHPDRNPIFKFLRRFVPVTDDYVEDRFFVKKARKYVATPLFIVLIVIETTDVMFALDSIPAILAITVDPFMVYSSNVFAILGLRALYFALAGVMKLFHYLGFGLSAILVFVGVKMLIAEFYEIPVSIALGVVAGILSLSIILSILKPGTGDEQTGSARLKQNHAGKELTDPSEVSPPGKSGSPHT
jgi:tellurite resistance protein TerC